MSRIIVHSVLACSLFQVGLANAQTARDRPAVEKQIVMKEKAIIDAILKADLKAFQTYAVPDGVGLGDNGPNRSADFDIR